MFKHRVDPFPKGADVQNLTAPTGRPKGSHRVHHSNTDKKGWWFPECEIPRRNRDSSSVSEQVLRPEHPAALEVRERGVHCREDLGGCLGDERARALLGLPDNVDLFGPLEGVLEFTFDTGRQARDAA